MIDSTTTMPGAAAQTAAQTASQSLGNQYQQFLTLLTAQISNQDPLKPMDATQFVSQLAQLSQVEQGVATNRNLEQVLAQLSNAASRSDLQMIGREVMIAGDRARLDAEGFHAGYELAAPAASVRIEIRAEDGTVIRTLQSDGLSDGRMHDIDWDGLDSQGLPVPDETLEFKVTALDTAGEPVDGMQFIRARVEGLTFTGNGPFLQLDTGDEVSSLAVRSVL